MLKSMGAPGRSKVAKGRLWIRLVILAAIMVIPFFKFDEKAHHYLSCDRRLYRKWLTVNFLAVEFILIFVLDFLTALGNMSFLMKNPGHADLREKFHRMRKKARK